MGRDKKVEGGALRFVLLDAHRAGAVSGPTCRTADVADLIR